ncbi:hypothetical protein OIDMADRAFT_134380 [Oidiodendron maius Zn]|uniref:Zn(2)-C6 fungal-type domain-containing protein n=1 Tax=Oidiodendron maius (strain Zn) TaxID=913774 RepID=A0A0C3GH44_OIDMZ|nr:hypothetical protein OIDMADRAFT_134380 [Oidiodendron maius Zn]
MSQRGRRTHTKSRGGCFECKRRKVKCNEAKPICAGCIKHETACEYPSALAAPSQSGGDSRRHAVRSDKLSPLILPSMAGLSVEWHHFMTSTAATMSAPWEKELPKIALSCTYLLHGMISTAALHLAYLDPDQRGKYQLLAAQHQNIALGPFQAEILNITSENCNQVFAFSLLLLVSHFVSFQSPDFVIHSSGATEYKGLATWIVWHRGCQTILNQARTYIKSGPLGPLIGEEKRAKCMTEAAKGFSGDDDDRTSTTITEMEAYETVVGQLRRLLTAFSHAEDSLTQRAFACIWPVIVPEIFIRLLDEMRPPALAIMAHYCLLLKKCQFCWYMENRAYSLFNAVQMNLDEEWTVCIQHPLRILGVDRYTSVQSSVAPIV